jgi:hypothetical protein
MPGSEEAYRTAYEASVRALQDQVTVLESLRSRAGTVFAATALVASFLGGQAFARSDRKDVAIDLWPPTAGGIAVLLFVVLAALTLAILWPYRIRFSVSAARLIGIIDEREHTSPVRPVEVYRELALRQEAMYDYNAKWIRRLFWCFRAAIVCLLGEAGAWIEVLREAA